MFVRGASLIIGVAALASCAGETVDPANPIPVAAAQPAVPSNRPAVEYDLVQLTLPGGDATAGRVAFVDLKCTGCHQVAEQPDLPSPVSDSAGPILGPDLASQPLGSLATSIVAPSHAMSIRTGSDTRGRVDGVLSPMGDYGEVMTVRQFLDILAFLDDARR